MVVISFCSKLGDIILRAMDSGSTGLSLSPDLGHCVVFLAKALLSHSISICQGVKRLLNIKGYAARTCHRKM